MTLHLTVKGYVILRADGTAVSMPRSQGKPFPTVSGAHTYAATMRITDYVLLEVY